MASRWFSGKRRGGIQTKLIVSYILLILVPMGLFGFLSNMISQKILEEQVSETNIKTLTQIKEKIEMMLDDIIAVSNIYYLNESVRKALAGPSDPSIYEYAENKHNVERLYANYVYAFGKVNYHTILVGIHGFEFVSDANVPKIGIEQWRNAPWYAEVEGKNGGIRWITGPAAKNLYQPEQRSLFSAARVVKGFETDRNLGLLILSVDEKELHRFYENAEIGRQLIEIVNEQGVVISSTDKTRINANITGDGVFQKSRADKSGYFIEEIHRKSMVVTYQTVEKSGWTVYSYMPMNQMLYDLNRLQLIQVLLFSGLTVLALIVSFVISRKMAVPIQTLYADINRVEMGDFSVRSTIQSRDEIGRLAGKFNRMVAKIEKLMQEVVDEQQKKRNAELEALQSQINPHFLYNTLASIRFMLAAHRPETVDTVIVALVKLLKMSLSPDKEMITIGEEIELLKQYVFIQQVRQGEQLEVYFELEDDILDFGMIKLLLQPIVENAIFHGIEPKGSKGIIFIRGWKECKQILFEISDDGVGMSTREGGLSAPELKSSGKGIGLKNVQHRLKLHYGEACGFSVSSEQGEGTVIRIAFPAILLNEGSDKDHERADCG